jgi:hypothetical protein
MTSLLFIMTLPQVQHLLDADVFAIIDPPSIAFLETPAQKSKLGIILY